MLVAKVQCLARIGFEIEELPFASTVRWGDCHELPLAMAQATITKQLPSQFPVGRFGDDFASQESCKGLTMQWQNIAALIA